MAVVTYKKIDGVIVCERIHPEFLGGQLAGGWVLSKAKAEGNEDPKEIKNDRKIEGIPLGMDRLNGFNQQPEESDPVTKEEADTNDSGKLSSQEIRAAAQEAGIEGYETKRIKTLEAELWPTQKLT